MNHIGSIAAMIICVAMSAYFSATETAFSALNKTRLKVLSDSGNKRAALTLKLSNDYDKLISTILIGNNIVNIAVASIGTLLFVELCGDIGATVSTVVVTIVVLIFGEITPKSVAKDSPERFAMFSAPFLKFWIVILTPLNFIFSKWKKLVSKVFKSDAKKGITHEELLVLVDDVRKDGGIDEQEGELLKNAIEFRDLTAAEILTPRVEIEAVDINSDYETIAQRFTQTRYSRLLVYSESIDKVVGVIHQKDFYANGNITTQSLTDIITEPVYVYRNVKLRVLLNMLQAKKSHIAIVLDEFGGTLGIVTMEDILEELVGEIWDEHDEIEEAFVKLTDGKCRVDCSVTVDDFAEFFNVKIESESVSVGGWVMECIGSVPALGDTFSYAGLSVRVCGLDVNRVEFVEVSALGSEVGSDGTK